MNLFVAGTSHRLRALRLLTLILVAPLFAPLAAQAALTVTPLTWNIIGLDSNSPTAGPQNFPIGARICSDIATTNVNANFVFDSANANIDFRPGSLSLLNFPSIGAGACADAYFEVQVNQVAAAYNTTRRYHIAATDGTGTYSTPTPRELYVEHLISQSRNSITDVKYGTSIPSLVSVPAGGSMNLVVGNTYVIQLAGGTATQGYQQFEAFINFSNAVFQILSVNTTYSADNSPFVPNPNDKLYADACLWESDPNSPNYRACVGGTFNAGGSTVVTTYTIKIISGGGTSQTLSTLLYDFSGSSFHYNGDFSVGARVANVIDPTSANISKSFSPNPASINGVSVLTITLTNPNPGALSGYNFVDNLPANLIVASPNGATTSGCGAPTLTANAGSSSIAFSNGTVAANGTCVIRVNVTPTATGSLVNTTNDLFIDSVDTGHNATATLTVNTAPPPGTGLCGVTLANWSVPNGTTANPPDLAGGVPTVKAGNVATATLVANVPANTAILTTSGHIDTTSWSTFGYKNAGQFIQFAVDTTSYTGVQMGFWVANPSPANGPTQITVAVDSGAGFGAPVLTINAPAAAFTQHTIDLTGLTNTGGNTLFRVSATGANNDASGASLLYDDMVFSGCTTPVQPTIAKNFAPASIAVNAVSTLTFTLINTNSVALTSAAFTDALPGGVQVAATPAAATSCGGTWAPTAGNTSLSFTGGTIPANGSCTVSVNVTATTAGPHSNVSGFLSTSESGTNTNNVAAATLTALSPPHIDKVFSPSPILAGGTSTLSFTITNPNQNDSIGGIAFSDTFPTSPGAMVVAATPNASTTGCGAPTFSPSAGAGSIAFSGGTIAAGASCSVSVDVTVPAVGTYNNTSGPVSFVINAQTVNGNTANASLTADAPNPGIGLLKQVSLSAAGPWTPFVAVNLPNDVFYQFTIENTGDVPLSPITLTDNLVNVSSCTLPGTLPVAVAANNNHIFTCIVGPVAAVAGSHTNTASATGNFGGTVVSDDGSATYASTGLTLAKSVTETTYTLPGDTLHYSYLVTNSGFAPLQGPVVVADDKAADETCPAVSTVGDLDNFLDPGESVTCTATYTITATDITNASVTNIASAGADGTTSNTDSRTVPLSTSADVSIDKTLTTAGPYSAGQSVTYTLTVANAGPSTATNIQVTDTPTNLTITNVSGSGCAALPCTIASLASGANTQIFVTATLTASGAFDNTATANATQPDPNTNNNTDNTNNGGTTGASADVSVNKTLVTAGPYTVGQSLTYTLFIANAGPSTATSILVTDTPTNLTITNVSGGGCAALPCTISSLASGANATITVTATINAAGAFDNSATVSATEPDPNPSNNTDSTGNGGSAGAPQLTVSKSASPNPFTVGVAASYTVTVTNTGSAATSANISVSDTLPSGITLSSASGTNWSCVGTSSLTCTFTGTLAASASTTLTLNVSVGVGASNGDNTATASGGGDSTCPATARCSGTVPVGVVAPQLSTSKSGVLDNSVVAPSNESNPGDKITYTITVANNGTGVATGVNLADVLLPTLACRIGASPVTLPTNLNAGASLICTATYTLTTADVSAGNVSNTATTTASNVCNPSTAGSTCTATVGTPLALVAVISTTKVGVLDNSVVPPSNQSDVGDQINYTITVNNSGNGPATGINISDAKLGILTCSIGANPTTLPTTIPAGATLTCTGTYTLTSADVSNGTVNNTATVSGSNVCPPGTACSSTEVTPLGAVPILAVAKTASPNPFVVGQPASYTITVSNNGSAATTAPITINDSLPSGITLASAAGTNWSCTGTTSLTCTFSGTLNATATTTLTLNVTVGAAATTADNSASVSGGGDPTCPTAARCSHTIPVTVTAPQLTVSKGATPNPFIVGQPASYTVTVLNSGSAATFGNIIVSDALPVGITLSGVSGNNWTCSGTTSLTCTFSGTLAVGASTTLTLNVNVAASATSGNNTATASGGGDPSCPATARCTDTVPVGIASPSAPQLTVTKSASPNPFVVGQQGTYTITVTNTGTAATTGSIALSDTLRTGITLVSAAGSNWTCSGTTALSCTFTGTLTSTASTSLVLTVGVGPTATKGNNTATASGGGDPTCPAAARCSGSVPVGVGGPPVTVRPIPVDARWALWLLLALLVATGAMRRRSL